MATATKTPAKYDTPLRQAQRDQTRTRIKTAARDLFHERHYDATTMDEIAAAAGLRRSTLYLHYRDKAEILGDVIADYAPKAKAVLSRLPGPAPALRPIQAWVRDVAKVVDEERVHLSIILELRRRHDSWNALENLTNELLAAMGEHNPAFRAAAIRDADPMLRARGLLLLQELTYSCEIFLENPSDPRGKAMLKATAEDFHAFLTPKAG